MSIWWLIILAALTSTPIVMAVIVSIASRIEDSGWTLEGPAPGGLAAAARRMMAARCGTGGLPTPRNDPRAAQRPVIEGRAARSPAVARSS